MDPGVKSVFSLVRSHTLSSNVAAPCGVPPAVSDGPSFHDLASVALSVKPYKQMADAS